MEILIIGLFVWNISLSTEIQDLELKHQEDLKRIIYIEQTNQDQQSEIDTLNNQIKRIK